MECFFSPLSLRDHNAVNVTPAITNNMVNAQISKKPVRHQFLFDVVVATVAGGQLSAEKHNYNDIINSF